MENPRESTDKHLDQTQVHQYAKHQINIKTSIFLYDRKKLAAIKKDTIYISKKYKETKI